MGWPTLHDFVIVTRVSGEVLWRGWVEIEPQGHTRIAFFRNGCPRPAAPASSRAHGYPVLGGLLRGAISRIALPKSSLPHTDGAPDIFE